jgi:hypothetical protein
MGSLADLIIAESGEAPAIIASEYPLGTFKGINVDGLDPVNLAALHSTFTDVEFNELLEHYKPIAEATSGGPWLVKLPVELITFLAELAPQDQASAAEMWISTVQLLDSGWAMEDAEKYLASLMHFAQIAAFESKELFVWICG